MITLKSHGFKFSRPDANLVFDVSYFINPWRDISIREEEDPELRKQKILDFMNAQKDIVSFVESMTNTLACYQYTFPKENIQVAFCCSAGEYRSPSFVILVAEELKKRGIECLISQSPNSKL